MLHAYNPVVLENALIYFDYIHVAKAALKIGAEEMKESLLHLGFQEELPFEIVMAKSQYSNTENIETEIQLADSGYGQGRILVNPLHMACVYTAFCNEGNGIKPYLIFNQEAESEYWIPGAFSTNNTNLVLEGTKKVVNDSHGTGTADKPIFIVSMVEDIKGRGGSGYVVEKDKKVLENRFDRKE